MTTQSTLPVYLSKVTQLDKFNTRIQAVRITNDKYVSVFHQVGAYSKGRPVCQCFSKSFTANLNFKFHGFAPISQADFKALANTKSNLTSCK
jgi:hypothetical protein